MTSYLSRVRVSGHNSSETIQCEVNGSLLRWIKSWFSDKPIGWLYEEDDRFAKTVDGRWVDRERDDEYGEWLITTR